MKSKLLQLRKVLLVAAGLFVGASGAWAEDKNYSQVFKYTYENAETLTEGLTIGDGTSVSQYTIGAESYLKLACTWKEGTNTFYDFSSAVEEVADYKFSFVFGYSPCGASQGSAGTVLTVTDSDGGELFHFDSDALGNGTTRGTITVYNGETGLGTFSVDTRYNDNLSYAYTVTVTGDETDGVKLDIQDPDGKTVTLSNSTLSSDFKLATKLNLSMRGGGNSSYPARAILDNVYFGKAVEGSFAEMPTFALKAVSGANRIYTLENSNEEGTLYYTTVPAESAPAVGDEAYSTTSAKTVDVTYTESGTYYAYVALEDGTTSVIASEIVTVGAITLADAIVTHSAANQYTIQSDQSKITGTPTATIHYQVGTGEEKTSTNASVTVSITEDGTITYWLTADGYTSTEQKTVNVYVILAKALDGTIDFRTSSSNAWAHQGDEVEVANDEERTYYQYKDQDGNILGNGILATTFNRGDEGSWRIQQRNAGTAPYNNGTEYVALLGLKKGQIVQYTCGAAPVIVANLTVLEAETYAEEYAYTVNEDGNAIISLVNGTVIRQIDIYSTSVSATIGSTGYATFASDYALDFTDAEGVTAYYATDAADGQVTMEKVTGTVAAGEGLFLQGEGTVSIPVVATGAELEGNLLVRGEGKDIEKEEGCDKYVLGAEDGSVAFYLIGDVAATVAKDKAYLQVDAAKGEARLSIVFGGETTGIDEAVVNGAQQAVGTYNLNGQRVAQPTKGLYIVNGKKVIIK